MFLIVAIMVGGMLTGYALRNRHKFVKMMDAVVLGLIFLLLLLLGISVGSNKLIIDNIDKIGLSALWLTLGAVSGTLITSYFTYIIFFKKHEK